MTLRRVLVWAAAVLSIAATTACAALIVLTTLLRATTDDLIHVGEQRMLATDLMNHALTIPYATTSEAHVLLEGQGKSLLARVDEVAKNDRERSRFAPLQPELEHLWAAPPGSFPSRELLADLRGAQDGLAREAYVTQSRARTLDGIANAVGIALGSILLIGVAFSMWCIRYFVSRPLRALAESVDRFAHGDLTSRAPERGAAELRMLAHTHNEMADAVADARLDQLQYVASVAQDLRNPLAAIQLAVGYVSPNEPLPPESRVREIFDRIDGQLRRVNSVVGDILGAVEADLGEIVLRREPCDVTAIARQCVDLFQSLSPAQRFVLHDTGLTALVADKRRLEHVINNLLSNAAKYSPLGSVVDVEVRGDAESLAIAVADQGPGIAPELRDAVFRPFLRGKSEHEEVPGVGLGLYVARKIVEAHGGNVEVESRLGAGSTFTARFPRTGSEV